MTPLEIIGAIALVLCGSTFMMVLAILMTKPEPPKPVVEIQPRDKQSIYLAGKWYAERQEALAEEAVAAFGWSHDPYSIQAEICREVVTCGRHPADAERRLQELGETASYEN